MLWILNICTFSLVFFATSESLTNILLKYDQSQCEAWFLNEIQLTEFRRRDLKESYQLNLIFNFSAAGCREADGVPDGAGEQQLITVLSHPSHSFRDHHSGWSALAGRPGKPSSGFPHTCCCSATSVFHSFPSFCPFLLFSLWSYISFVLLHFHVDEASVPVPGYGTDACGHIYDFDK